MTTQSDTNIKTLQLLKKYIRHILYHEGIDYLSEAKLKDSSIRFTNEEVDVLRSYKYDVRATKSIPSVLDCLPRDRDKLRICIMDAMIEAEYQNEQWNDADTVNLAVQKLLGESPIQYAK